MEYLAQNWTWKLKNVIVELFSTIPRWFRLAGKVDAKRSKRPLSNHMSAHIRRDIGLPVEACSPPTWFWDL